MTPIRCIKVVVILYGYIFAWKIINGDAVDWLGAMVHIIPYYPLEHIRQQKEFVFGSGNSVYW